MAMALYAFDGTLDDDREVGTDQAAIAKETNVWKFYSAYDGYTKPRGISNVYVPGVGTRFGAAGLVLGATLGAGWLDRINAAYDAVCAAYANGDRTIDIVGFSRGAAIALDFANKVARSGITRGGAVIEANPAIRFVGLFDVVAAFGVANLGFVFSDLNIGHNLDLPGHVGHCFHAMALDERRPSFVVTRVAGAYETWFRGVHSDIGGGNENLGLNNITLRWMYRKAILAGLPVTEANISDDACHPEARIKPDFFSDLSQLTWRDLRSSDTVHYTVALHQVLSDEPCRDVPAGLAVETAAFERQRPTPPAGVTT
jgi:uncharacterized protein (DUF2235 family)